jgi:hypothetical protein
VLRAMTSPTVETVYLGEVAGPARARMALLA